MQTLQNLADSLQDPVRIASIKEKLQGIPSQLLPRSNSVQDGYLFGTVTGEYNFHFTFRLEGGGFFQSGVLVASAENTPGGMPVPLRCKWKRKIHGMLVEIPSVTSNMYQISADDIGTDISVEASPADLDDGHSGTAYGELGPFELDPSTRRSLDNALGTGSSRFTVEQSSQPGDRNSVRVELAVEVSMEGVKIVPTQSEGAARASMKEVMMQFTPDYPKVIIHPLDTTKFQLILSDNRTFHLQTKSRTARDLFAMTVRCFHSQKYCPTGGILQELFPILPFSTNGTPTGGSQLDECIVLEHLAMEVNKAMVEKVTQEKVLRNTHRENRELRAQLEETIRACSEGMADLQEKCSGSSQASAVPAAALQSQCEAMLAQNKELDKELQNKRKQLEDAIKAKSAKSAGSLAPEIAQLREKRDMLKARLQELSSTSGQQRDQADQVHAHELKRLRNEVEKLHNEKEDMLRQLQDAERNKQELQENLLYVKGQLDKVQVRQAQSTNGNAPEDKEVQRLRDTMTALADEKASLMARMESTQKDLEKEKNYHEVQIERLMAANAQARESKDRAEQEVQRLSQLYASTVQQVQQDGRDNTNVPTLMSTDSTVDFAPPKVDTEDLTNLRVQIAQVEEALKKREQENESLKNRIRKLAVA